MSSWEQATLDKLGILKSGRQTHKPEYDPSLFCEGTVPLIESQLIENNQLFVENVRRYYNALGVKQSKIFESGTVCITRTGNVARTSIIKDPSCLSSRVHGFTPYKSVTDSKFIKYSFEFRKIRELCQKYASANTETKVLTIDRILKIPFPKPPLDIQQKIGRILSTYDLLIENYEKQIDLLKNQRTKLFQRWFINHKFPNYIDTNPSNWKSTPLKDFVNFKAGPRLAGQATENGLYPFFTCSKETPKINSFSFDQEALLLSVGGNNRHIKYCCGKFDAMILVYVLTLEHKYIYWLLETIRCLLPVFNKMSKGTTIPRLSIEAVKRFKLLLSPDNLLNLFNQFAEPIQKQIDYLSRLVDIFSRIKSVLVERIYSEKLNID